MTIAKTGNKAQASGNGVTVAFAFPYRFFAESDLGVYILSAAGVETKKTLTTHYSVSNTGTESGGTVTFLTAPATGETVTIVGEIPLTQTADYTANDAFPAETHEAALDRGVRLVQRVQEQISRAVVAPVSDTSDLELPDAATRAGKYLYFNSITGDVEALAGTALAGTTDILMFNNAAQTVGVGELAWNDTDKTLDLGMTANVTLQVGQEMVHYCRNNSGVAITNGQAVRITGASGNSPTIALADATDVATSTNTIGLATEDIANGANGMVTLIGLVRGLNTDAWVEGDVLYLSETAGALTTTSPVYPAQSIRIGTVVRDHATLGSIFVHPERIENGFQPVDADLTALAAIAGVQGDIIYRNATVWTRLAKGTAGQVLAQNAGLTAPEWVTKNGGANLQAFTASGTYTPSSGYKSAIIICTGGGEAGEACTSTVNDKGRGGIAGATAFAIADISAGTPLAVTVGAGGTSSLGNGGTTSVGAACSASGGGDTYAVTGVLGVRGGNGGGDGTANGNFGGASFWGGGAEAPNSSGNTGVAALIYGAGGSGAFGNGSILAGGAGAAGVVLIMEFK